VLPCMAVMSCTAQVNKNKFYATSTFVGDFWYRGHLDFVWRGCFRGSRLWHVDGGNAEVRVLDSPIIYVTGGKILLVSCGSKISRHSLLRLPLCLCCIHSGTLSTCWERVTCLNLHGKARAHCFGFDEYRASHAIALCCA
jgi:hypothetical protein